MATANKDTPRLSKRMKAVRGKVDHVKSYPIDEALKLVKETATAKFDESVDVAVNLGVDAKKSDQTVRGSVVLPAGTGKKVRVAVFAQGDKAKIATEAGADIVGFDDLAAKVDKGSQKPHTDKVGKLTRAQAEEIAKLKMPDLTASDLDAAVRTVAGSARSMGITVEGVK